MIRPEGRGLPERGVNNLREPPLKEGQGGFVIERPRKLSPTQFLSQLCFAVEKQIEVRPNEVTQAERRVCLVGKSCHELSQLRFLGRREETLHDPCQALTALRLLGDLLKGRAFPRSFHGRLRGLFLGFRS